MRCGVQTERKLRANDSFLSTSTPARRSETLITSRCLQMRAPPENDPEGVAFGYEVLE